MARLESIAGFLLPGGVDGALGVARQDDVLVRTALEDFERFGLGFHAEETRLVLEA